MRTQPFRKNKGKLVNNAGCIGCGGVRSPRWRYLSSARCYRLQKWWGIKLMFGKGSRGPYACAKCFQQWYRLLHATDDQLQAGEEDDDMVFVWHEGGDEVAADTGNASDASESESEVLVADQSDQGPSHLEVVRFQTTSPHTSLNNENSCTDDLQRGLQLLISHPFAGRPFDDPVGFIAHLETFCGGLFSAKARVLLRDPAKLDQRAKLRIIATICLDVGAANSKHSNYIKDFMTDILQGTSDSKQKVLSRLGFGWHPSSKFAKRFF